jgi:hypothetical protein
MTVLNPRDIRCITGLRDRGVTLVEIRVTCMFGWLHQPVGHLPLPPNSRVMCIGRGTEVLLDPPTVYLQEHDTLFLLTQDVRALRRALQLDS